MQHSASTIQSLYAAAIAACHPMQVLPQHIEADDSFIRLGSRVFDRNKTGQLKVVAIGKAAAAMMQQVITLLPNCINEALCITKYGHALALPNVHTIEAGHPIPDANSVEAAKAVEQILQQIKPEDIVLLLLSGGASSLIADLPAGITVDDLQHTTAALLKSGANIAEMNAVRKHLATLKGGQLAAKGSPATVVTLAISDVPGNDPGTIGSGLTVADSSTYADAIRSLVHHKVWDRLTHTVQQYLHDGHNGIHPETPKPGELNEAQTHFEIVADNRTALHAAAATAYMHGYSVQLFPDVLNNDVDAVANLLIKRLLEQPITKPVCLIAGGESTVRVSGHGKGGRNMHLAALLLKGFDEALPPGSHLRSRIQWLCAGTDGTDGPTDAAGAVAGLHLFANPLTNRGRLDDAIARFDTYPFFEAADTLLRNGPTQTNVMDLVMILVNRQEA